MHVLVAANVPVPPEVWAVIITCSVASMLVVALLRSSGDKRARGKVTAWAEQNRLELLTAEVIPTLRGPFRMKGYWTSVFRVKVREASGAERGAWLCTGNFFIWFFSASPDVRWDSPPP